MALDYGERRIGVALSDTNRMISYPYKTIDAKKNPDVIREISLIIKDQNVEMILVGNPETFNGEDSAKSKDIKGFISKLQHHVSIPIKLWNESFTTKNAIRVLVQGNRKLKKHRNKVDQIAASLILKDYLDQKAI